MIRSIRRGRDILPTQAQVASYRAEKIRMDFQVGENEWAKKIIEEGLGSRLYLIFGSPGAGKDAVRDIVLSDEVASGFIKDTTRPMRDTDVDGVTYNFHPTKIEEDSETLGEAREKGLLSYKYDGHYYWFDAEKLYKKLKENEAIVLVLGGGTPQEVEEMKKILPECTALFVSPPGEDGKKPEEIIFDRFKSRSIADGTSARDPEALKRRERIIKENYMWGLKLADHVIYNPTETNPELIGEEGARQVLAIIAEDRMNK